MTGTTYRLKKIINGFELGQAFAGKKYIAVPQKLLLGNQYIKAQYRDKFMVITPETKVVTSQEFPDKFGRDKWYRLCYFEWEAEKI